MGNVAGKVFEPSVSTQDLGNGVTRVLTPTVVIGSPVAVNPDGPHKFIDVLEQTRTYFYPNGQITLEGVKSINVSKSGTHRINLANGKKRIMPAGWLSIEFDAEKWTF